MQKKDGGFIRFYLFKQFFIKKISFPKGHINQSVPSLNWWTPKDKSRISCLKKVVKWALESMRAYRSPRKVHTLVKKRFALCFSASREQGPSVYKIWGVYSPTHRLSMRVCAHTLSNLNGTHSTSCWFHSSMLHTVLLATANSKKTLLIVPNLPPIYYSVLMRQVLLRQAAMHLLKASPKANMCSRHGAWVNRVCFCNV